jgi:hypothetical protein
MVAFKRQLNLLNILIKNHLVKEQLGDSAILFNLLRSDTYLKLASAPWELEPMINAALSNRQYEAVVIDEIQKIPSLLDEVNYPNSQDS